ncbi:hypothetical protein BDZ97DRAFT_1911380 [Flammula alnicola]|nr:hypothetical protein BDZ97DRAFT_1911380 [Flammula alnicola]
MSTERTLRSRTRQMSTPAVEDDIPSQGHPESVDDDVDDSAARDLMVPDEHPTSHSSSDGEEDSRAPPVGVARAQAPGPDGTIADTNSRGRPSGVRRAVGIPSRNEGPTSSTTMYVPEANVPDLVELSSEEIRKAMKAVSESKAQVDVLLPFMDAILNRLDYLEGKYSKPAESLGDQGSEPNGDEESEGYPEIEYQDDRAEPSDKGKGTDPREWGNVNIPEADLNIEGQRVRFAEIAAEQNNNGSIENNGHPTVENSEDRLNRLYEAYMTEKLNVEKARKFTKQGAPNERISDSPLSKDLEDIIGHDMSFMTPEVHHKNTALLPSTQLNPSSLVGKLLNGNSGRTVLGDITNTIVHPEQGNSQYMNDIFTQNDTARPTALATS